MDVFDASYLGLSALAGAAGRSLRSGLPPGWRLRLGAEVPDGLAPGWIWLHAVSVGEILLAEGIAGRFAQAGQRVHVTTGTPAGLALLEQKIRAWNQAGGRFSGGGFPFDDPRGLRPFLASQPSAFVALETEIWPGLLRALQEAGVPAAVVNGRLTAKSLGRGGPWLRRAAGRIGLVVARDEDSCAAFRHLGAPKVVLGGNLKTDLPPPPRLHPGWGLLEEGWATDRVVVAGNTVEGEEEILLRAWKRARAGSPGLRLILAPRQPRRFAEAADLLEREKVGFRRASQAWPEDAAIWSGTPVLLLDTLGELASAYRLASLALVGGGWTWDGGHNPLEPIRWGVPTWLGPGYANFTDLVEPLRQSGLVKVVDKNDIEIEFTQILNSLPTRGLGFDGFAPRLPPGWNGALEKTWSHLQEFLITRR
jgi:3-deoxy-D-manno-octulosonic-acid transferase